MAEYLALCEDDGIRNGAEAVLYGLKAVELEHAKRTLRTLAICHMEAGEWDKAEKILKSDLFHPNDKLHTLVKDRETVHIWEERNKRSFFD